MAPEAVQQQPYNEKVDIYSFGVILRLLHTGAAAKGPRESEEAAITTVEQAPDTYTSTIDPAYRHPTLTTASAIEMLIGTT